MRKFTPASVTLQAATGDRRGWLTLALLLLLGNDARAGLIDSILSPYNQAGEDGYFFDSQSYFSTEPINSAQHNYDVNVPISLSDAYNGLPDYPSLNTSASANLSSDWNSFISAQVQAASYANPISTYGTFAYVETGAQSDGWFTVTSPVTATLVLEAHASASSVSDQYSQAGDYVQFYDYQTGTNWSHSADVENGTSDDYQESFTVNLDPGQYLILLSAYGTGDADPAAGDIADESAYGRVSLYDIQPAATTVPEPPTFLTSSILLGLFGVAPVCKKLKRAVASAAGPWSCALEHILPQGMRLAAGSCPGVEVSRAAARQSRIWLTLALLSFGGSHASAGVIGSLFNTGVDGGGQALTTTTDGAHGISDPHYSLISAPAGQSAVIEVYDYDQWIAGSLASAWITPYGFGNGYGDHDVGAPGVYDYRTTFDLTGFDPATALILGQWAADNQGIDILINGTSTGQQSLLNRFYGPFTSFSITGGFVAGINTLDFLVDNSPGTPEYYNNPTGLRVEFLSATAAAASTAVPEPSTWVMLSLLSGIFGAAGAYRRMTGRG
jgi:hypothetical protein